MSAIAAKLELAYPRLTPWEISEMAREALIRAGDGPPSETMSRDGKSVTPHVDRAESIKLENSPKTPTLTLQSQTFLSASQRTPPRPTRPEQRTSSISMEQLPTYEYSPHLSVSSIRQHFEERDHPLYDSNYFAEVYPIYIFIPNLISRKLWRLVHGHFINLLLGRNRYSIREGNDENIYITTGWEGTEFKRDF